VKVSGWHGGKIGSMIYWINPKTHLIARIAMEMKQKGPVGIMDIAIEAPDNPPDRGLFTLDTAGLTIVGDYQGLNRY